MRETLDRQAPGTGHRPARQEHHFAVLSPERPSRERSFPASLAFLFWFCQCATPPVEPAVCVSHFCSPDKFSVLRVSFHSHHTRHGTCHVLRPSPWEPGTGTPSTGNLHHHSIAPHPNLAPPLRPLVERDSRRGPPSGARWDCVTSASACPGGGCGGAPCRHAGDGGSRCGGSCNAGGMGCACGVCCCGGGYGSGGRCCGCCCD